MNRLAPLIARHSSAAAPPAALEWGEEMDENTSQLIDDLRLFATGWLGGLVFFGTFLA